MLSGSSISGRQEGISGQDRPHFPSDCCLTEDKNGRESLSVSSQDILECMTLDPLYAARSCEDAAYGKGLTMSLSGGGSDA